MHSDAVAIFLLVEIADSASCLDYSWERAAWSTVNVGLLNLLIDQARGQP